MPPEQKTNGALIGSIIIIIILIVGGIYLWQVSMTETTPTDTNMEATDDTSKVEADVDNIDTEGLDEGL